VGGGDPYLDEHNVTYTVSKMNDTYQTMMDVKDALMMNEEFDNNNQQEAAAAVTTPNPVDHNQGFITNDILNI
jgi:hypothetical protein